MERMRDSGKMCLDKEKTPRNYIEKDATNIIKGFALIFMFIHHFFTFPSFYIEGISYPYLEEFARIFNEPFKICVSVFAFLSGYFYVFVQKKSFRYSLKKSTDVWIVYFFFFLVLLIPAAALGCWDGSVMGFMMESIGLKHTIVMFSWYVDFYIIAVFLLLPYHLLSKKHIAIAVVAGILLPIGIGTALTGRCHIPNKELEKLIFDLITWFPCIASGYIFARYELFEKWFDFLFKRFFKYKLLRVVIAVVLMLIAFMGRYYTAQISFNISVFTVGFSLDFLTAPIFIYGLLNVIYAVSWKKLFLPISVIGKYSLGMWFAHGIFFNVCKEYTQRILYFPKNPIAVLLWGLALCLTFSYAMTKAIEPIIKLKNKLIFRQKPNKVRREA